MHQIEANAGEGKDDVIAALFEKETHTMNVQFQPQMDWIVSTR